MNLTVKIRTALLSVLAVIVFGASLLVLGNQNFNTPYQYELVQLDDGWTVSYGEKTWKLDSIRESNIGIINMGETITLSRTLPVSDLSPATIRFRTILSTVKVFVDGKEIYSYGQHYADTNWMLPKMLNFVQLPKDYSGKTITIEITACENNAFPASHRFCLATTTI